MTQPLSKHRHISFTAHYTGYIWYQMGISHPVFATSKGKFLASLVHPLETWAEKHVGGSMRSTLKQRHTIIDQCLQSLIETHHNIQILEIACGLSPRGWTFRKNHPNLIYRELDLPDMAATKQYALSKIEKNSPEVFAIDLFSDTFIDIFQQFDTNKPLVIISEGLINYFELDVLAELIIKLSKHGKSFPAFYYLTDIYPEPIKNKLAHFIWSSSKLLKWISRSSFRFHFQNPLETILFFKQAGFQKIRVIQPQTLKNRPSTTEEVEHLGDLVWVIKAEL